jgi:hypothetical protein
MNKCSHGYRRPSRRQCRHILDETLPPEVTLFELAAGTPLVWEEQWGEG